MPYWMAGIVNGVKGLDFRRDEPLACPLWSKGSDSTRSPAPWPVEDKATGVSQADAKPCTGQNQE